MIPRVRTSFFNDPKLKQRYLGRVLAHERADEIVHGQYWQGGKGCAVGCTLERPNEDGELHGRYETELGIPRWLAHLEDAIFEGVSNGEAMRFPRQFLEAVPVGATIEEFDVVRRKFLIWLLTDKRWGERRFAKKGDPVYVAVSKVAQLHGAALKGKPYDAAAWSAARSAARSAAESAAESAARSAAESAARSAAWSAAWSAARSAAESAARSAAWSAAESAARSAAWSAAESAVRLAQKKKLLSLLKTMPAHRRVYPSALRLTGKERTISKKRSVVSHE